MDISVVVPLYNEDESIAELHEWIKRVMDANGFSYEVIFVNDGSTDRSWEVIEKLSQEFPEVHGIKFRRNYGKSPALFHGFERAEGDVVITMDADLQDSPDEIPELYRMVKEEGYDLVSGFKMNRRKGDPLSKTIPTKLFNATTRMVSGIHNLHDFNCGLKAYRKDVVKHIEVYGEMHRFIPYLAKNAGFSKIGEKPVHHQARQHGKSKFMGLNRFVNEAHAHLRFHRHPHVHHRLHRHRHCWHHQGGGFVPACAACPGYRQPLLLYLTDNDDSGHAIVCRRIPR